MKSENHLSTARAKIQAGVSIQSARTLAREILRQEIESFAMDVDLLLGFVCGISKLYVMTDNLRVLSGAECESFNHLLTRRVRGEPVAYLLGEKEFFGLPFIVNKNVLIPRPDTEVLVEEALKIVGDRKALVLDVCTGSGCIALAIAHNAPFARVVATDISAEALQVAQENAKILLLDGRVEFQLGNLLESSCERDVDLIVSNPPYICEHEIPTLMKDVREFEPKLALIGKDEDGLGLHRELLSQGLKVLKTGGTLLMEIGAGQAEILLGMHFPGYSKAEFLKDYSGVSRVVKYNRLLTQNREGVFNG